MDLILDERSNRIHELDFARGVAILGVLVVHFFSFADFFGGWNIDWAPAAYFIKQYCGAFFVFLSGVSACLGSHHIRSGLIVLSCAFLLTAASAALYLSGFAPESVLIQWGVLHTLGVCKLISPGIRKLPRRLRILLGLGIVVLGYWLRADVRVMNPWIFMFGLRTRSFKAFDYFPLLPHVGWFMLGTVLGEYLYADRDGKPLFPEFRCSFLEFFGRNSLLFFMLHQPLYVLVFHFILNRGV